MATDRRTRNRNADGMPDRRQRNAEDQEQEQQEQQQREAEAEKKEQRDAAQDTIGNQGIASMLGLSAVKPGEAGLAAGAQQEPERARDLQHGGDDPPEDGPLTLDDLVRSWNPTIRRGQDTAPGTLGELDGLPEEDEALFAEIRADRSPVDLPPAQRIDPLLQPSADAVASDLRPWVRQAARFCSSSLSHRTWLRALSPPARVLVDPGGRLLHTRARIAALASLLLLDGLGSEQERLSPLVGFALELACRGAWIDRALELVREREIRLPVARDVLEPLLEGMEGGEVALRELPAAAAAQLGETLIDVLDFPSASTLLPSLELPEQIPDEEEEIDPLADQLDEILAGTLGREDPLRGVYDAALQGAERLAGAAARLRVHGAGLLAAIGEVCEQWSSGAPTAQLLALAEDLDREVTQTLHLLVDIGRACQRRSVAPSGIRNGLRRAARALDAAAMRLIGLATALVGGVLPEVGEIAPPPAPQADDPLSVAWADGTPGEALPWLAALPTSLDRDVATALTRAAAGETDAIATELWVLSGRTSGAPALSGALGLAAGAALMRRQDPAAVLAVAEVQMAAARERRNGVWLAASALLAVEAHHRLGDTERAVALRRSAARLCWLFGARSALSLLLRWRPPRDDEDDDGITGSDGPT